MSRVGVGLGLRVARREPGRDLAERLRVLGCVRVGRCGGLTEKMRLEWPWLVLL